MSTSLPWFKFRCSAPEELAIHELCGLTARPEADVYVYRLWAYCGRERPEGTFPGAGATSAIERAVRWTGKRGRLVQALIAVGLLAEQDGLLVVAGWREEQAGHVAKVARDAAKPSGKGRTTRADEDGSTHESREEPEQAPRGSLAAPARDQRGESGETRRENNSPASQSAPADSPEGSLSDSDSPDSATMTPRPSPAAVAAPARESGAVEPFALEEQRSGRKPRRASVGETAYFRMEEDRQEACEAAGEVYIREGWSHARANSSLGWLARASPEERERFEQGWRLYLGDTTHRAKAPAWSIAFFLVVRAQYETMAVRDVTVGGLQ
ncbi:hypothetical protein DRW03_21365 [Corallococcus sp. H22C18031201]|nr:hypothetical protein DRW03_21365 [Corallococcus sp. H22C18031201]